MFCTAIAVSGDSFTEGWGARFEESFPVQLERALDAASDGVDFAVHSLGQAGYNTLNNSGNLRFTAIPLAKAATGGGVVVYAFYENDVHTGSMIERHMVLDALRV